MEVRIRPLVAAAVAPFAALFTGAVPAGAQTQQMDEVVVSAERARPALEASTVAPARQQQLRAASSDAASLLRDEPGVSLYGAGGVSSLPVITGLADDRLRVKVDGMDLIAACPNHMNPALSYIDPANVGKLTVYAGIAPVSIGGDSIGGAIIAQTRAPQFAAPGQGMIANGEVGAFYRSNNEAQGGNLSATLATENFSVWYNGAYSEADNYTAGRNFKDYTATGRAGRRLARDEVGSTAYETTHHALGLAWRGERNLFEISFGWQDMAEQNFPNQRMDLLDNQQKRVNLRWLGQFDWGQVEARAYREKVDHRMDFGRDKRYWYGAGSGADPANPTPCSPISATCAAGMPMRTESETLGASLKADVALGRDDLLRLGAEIQRYDLDDWWPPSGGGMWPGTFANIHNGERNRNALFAEWEATHNPQWLTLLGVRYEQVRMDAGKAQGYNPAGGGNQGRDADAFNARSRSRRDNNQDLAALTRYTVNANQDIEIGVARKVRSPGLYEAYPWSSWAMAAAMNNFVGDGNGYVGNPDLKPEKAYTLSASFDWHAVDRRWEFKAMPFYTHVVDYIDAIQWDSASNSPRTVPLRDQFTVLRYANQSARLYGLNLAGRTPLARSDFGTFGLQGVVNYTRGKNRDTGSDLYNIMPLNARLTLTQQLGGWDNALEIIGVAAKNRVSAPRNEMKTGGYGLINLRASYSWQRLRLDVGVENLFDRYYQMPLGGAYLGQGRTMSMTGVPYGVPVPGMGRSLYAGFNFKF
jgi:iron complex outermembrane receptor protein